MIHLIITAKKTADEFKLEVQAELTRRFEENPNVRTEMSVEEIDKEFKERLKL